MALNTGMDRVIKMGKYTNDALKKLINPLFKDGIGDKMDKGNLWIVPGFTIFAFAILWTTKLSGVAFKESTCRGAMIYNLSGTGLDDDAKRHCLTARRYYVGIGEPISNKQSWREQRQVKNPEWILWFWGPIVFVMYILTRYIWTLLMENQGINFNNIVNASRNVLKQNEGIIEIDEDKLYERTPVISDNFRSSPSSHAFAAFIVFELCLVLAPLLLLLVILPMMIGGAYRMWGLDLLRALWEKKEWQGVPLTPFFGTSNDNPVIPLIPRISYCDYQFVTLGNDQVVTYRCYMDSTWHERTAIFTWFMLVFLAFINLCNLILWIIWAYRMKDCTKRQKWVLKKWLIEEDYPLEERKLVRSFAARFKMGNLLMFYFIECHTDRVIARAFAHALYTKWLEKQQELQNKLFPNTFACKNKPSAPPFSIEGKKLLEEDKDNDSGLDDEPKDIGWTIIPENTRRQFSYP